MTEQELKRLLAKIQMGEIILEAIDACGLPTGHLYAACMTHMSLDTFNTIKGAFVESKALIEFGDYLTRGPAYSGALLGLKAYVAKLKEMTAA